MQLNYIVEVSVHKIILFCVISKDVNNLYKWQTFRLKGLHQSQILHADNNTTIIHDINRVDPHRHKWINLFCY